MANSVVSSGTVSTQTITNGGTMYVVSSGTADYTTVSSGGTQVVYSGGTTSFTDITSSGFVVVEAGGSAFGNIVMDGGAEYVGTAATATSGAIGSGGEIDVIGGTATGILVRSGGRMFALSGGSIFNANIQSGGLYVSHSEAYDTRLRGSGGLLYVTDGGAASDTTVTSGAEAYVEDGTMTDIAVSGGILYDESDAIVTSALVAHGEADVTYDGQLNEGTIGSGGSLFMSGTASVIAVLSGGYETLELGAQQTATVLSGGSVLIISGKAYGLAVNSGADLFINGGLAENAVVSAGGFFETYEAGGTSGELTGTLQSGAVGLVTEFGGFDGTLESGATLIVGGRNYANATIESGGHVISSGVAVIDRPGLTVKTFNAIDHQTFGTGADIIYVLSGGSANNVMITGDVSADVFSGGIANGITENDADLAVYEGAVVSNAAGFGGQIEDFGGILQSATIASGGGSYGFLFLDIGQTSGTRVKAGGDEVVSGGDAYNTTISSGGEQDVYNGAYTSNATVLSGGIEFAISGGVVVDPTIAGGTVNMVSGGSVLGVAQFQGSGGALFFESADLPQATIAGFGRGDTIEFTDINYSQDDRVTVGTPGVVTVTAGGESYDLNIAGAVSGNPYLLLIGADDSGLVLMDQANAPCFAAGTRILTPRGEVAVEALAVGDVVITNNGEDAPVVWIGRRRVDLARHPRPEQVRPVRIAADAFGDGVPARDLLLSPDHALFARDVLIPAKALINGRNVEQVRRATVTYFHIELAEHAVIFAENCAVESYLETGNRGAFENGGPATTLHPDFAQTLREQHSCAPFVDSGPVLEAVRENTIRQFYVSRATAQFSN